MKKPAKKGVPLKVVETDKTEVVEVVQTALALGPTPIKKYLRKVGVQERYSIDERTVDQYSRDGRLPRPIYLFNDRVPFWSVEELDQNDARRLANARRGELLPT